MREGVAQRQRRHMHGLAAIGFGDAPDGGLHFHLAQIVINFRPADTHRPSLVILITVPLFFLGRRCNPVGVRKDHAEHEPTIRRQMLVHAAQKGPLVEVGEHVHEDEIELPTEVKIPPVGFDPLDRQIAGLGPRQRQHLRGRVQPGDLQPMLRQRDRHPPCAAAQIQDRSAGLRGDGQEKRAFRIEVRVLQVVQLRVGVLFKIGERRHFLTPVVRSCKSGI